MYDLLFDFSDLGRQLNKDKMFKRAAAASVALLSLVTSPALALNCLNDDLAAVEPLNHVLPAYAKRQDAATAVDVYFHVTSTEANKDRITDDIVDAQVRKHPSIKCATADQEPSSMFCAPHSSSTAST